MKKITISLLVGASLVALAFALLAAGAARALAPCTVEEDGSGTHATIQAAVDDPGCTEVIVGNGAFYETVTITRTISVVGQGSNNTTIDGYANDSVFFIDGTFVPNMSVTIENLNITDGSANSGGGIHSTEATLTIRNSSVNGNWVSGGGGGVYSAQGDLNIFESDISLNHADTGGGIYVGSGTATIENSSIEDNDADSHAGGLYNQNGNVYLNRVSVSGNTTYVDGGGIFNYGTMTINNSSINNNESTNYSGGGIRVEGTTYINNSTISDNKSVVDAAGLSIWFGVLRLNSSTVVNNIGTGSSGGIDVENSDVRIQNSMVSGNIPNECIGTIRSNGYNIIADTSGCDYQSGTGDLIGTTANLGPMEGNPAYYPLLPGPGVNDGNPAGCADHLGQTLYADQRGIIRPDRCDIGSIEYVGLSIQKSAPSNAFAGEPVSYTLTVANHHTETLTSVVITDVLPFGATHVSGGTLVGNVVSWTIPTLAAGATITPQFVVTATETITNSDYRVSSAEGYGASGIPVVTIIVDIPIADLAVTNDSPTVLGHATTLSATISAGSNVNYTWNFGDGETGSGPVVTHTYPTTGLYTAEVTASNGVGSVTATTSVTVYVTPTEVYLPVLMRP